MDNYQLFGDSINSEEPENLDQKFENIVSEDVFQREENHVLNYSNLHFEPDLILPMTEKPSSPPKNTHINIKLKMLGLLALLVFIILLIFFN